MNTKKTIVTLMAVFLLTLANVYAADNGTEFGIEDDLTVLGTAGNMNDPDAEVKGFTLFGSTGPAQTLNIPESPGNIFISGYLQVSSGMYVNAGSTFAAGAYFNSVSSFTAGASSIFVNGGAAGQVLKYDGATGAMYWADDSGGVEGSGIKDYLPLWKTDTELTVSKVSQAEVGTDTHVYVNADLHLSSSVYFGNGASISTFTENGALSLASDGDIVLLGANAQITLPNIPVAGTDAANKTYVDSQVIGSGPWQRNGAEVTLDYIDDEVGVGIAAPLAKLHVSSASALAADYLLIVSSGTDNRLTIKGDGTTDLFGDFNINTNMFQVAAANGNTSIAGTLTIADLITAQNSLSVTGGNASITNNLTVNGNAQLGDAITDTHGVNMSPEANVALAVDGTGTSGQYISKFYSNGSLAAWIKKK